MEVEVKQINTCQLELSVEVPSERWVALLDEAYREYGRSVKIDGFRRGKIPMGILKKMFGPAIEGEAAEKAVREFYREALEKENIHAISPADIEDVDFGRDKSFTFKALVEVMPEFEIKGLEEMKTFLEEVEIENEDIEAGMQVLREEQAMITSHDRPIEQGCLVMADIQELDSTGIPVLTHNWKDVTLEIGKGVFGSEVDEQIIGIESGENIIIPILTGEKDEKGEPKKVNYRFDIKEIQRKELPEVDDEFASSINKDYKTVDDLRGGILELMRERANNRARVKMFSRLVDYLIENNRIDVPPSMLEWYLNRMLEDARQKNQELNEEKFKNDYRSSAIRNMKWYLLRRKIIEQSALNANDDEIENEIKNMSDRGGGDLEVLQTHFKMEKNRNRLKDDIEEQKVLNFLESKAGITLRKIPYREFSSES